MRLSETTIKEAALAWLESFGYVVKHDPESVPSEPAAERSADAAP